MRREIHMLLLTLSAFSPGDGSATAAAPLRIVRDGQSPYTICHAPDAPGSVRTAARELRDYIRRATGADLQIRTAPRPQMICLGDSPATRRAGLVADEIPPEGYRILTNGDSLYIAGPDTPDGGSTRLGGVSTGTLFGVYAFIRDVLNVRWLVPGPHGDDVPHTTDLVVPPTDVTRVPAWPHRALNIHSGPVRLTHREETNRWLARHGLGSSLQLSHGHAWRRTIPPELFSTHPEYFAMAGGERIDPVNGPSDAFRKRDPALGQNLLGLVACGRYKLCTTSDGLVRTYAHAVSASFSVRPDARAYSLSPSDGRRFCQCPDCAALHETDPHGRLSTTPAILAFYNGVARSVASRHRHRLLCGYVYASYQYPPTDRAWRPHPNLILVAAPSKLSYGVGLFRPGKSEEWRALMQDWRAITPHMAYYDMCGVLEQFHTKSVLTGAPNPPSIELLKTVFPTVRRTCRMGVHFTGGSAWGQIGHVNYLLASLIRDPDADVDAFFDEYCERAYGEAAPHMKKLCRLIDRAIAEHCRRHRSARYVLTHSMARDVYAAHYPEIESLFSSALRDARTPAQTYRLGLVRRNLVFLNWSLRRGNLIPSTPDSPLQLTDEQLGEIYESKESELALYPTRATWTQLRDRIPQALVPPRHSAKLSKFWYFQPDPRDEGVDAGWFRPEFDVSRWNRIGINDTWEDQGYGPPAYPGKGGYNGYAWYRVQTDRPRPKYRGWNAFIHFGAVDESCWVYVNGELAASFQYDPVKNPDSWEQPLELPLGPTFRAGEPNTIAIRVHDSEGAGGIWRGAILVFREPR